ncbi:ABC transporter substrate-binding protein [Paenibacillus periandrae]|uniref:ABC transporter substrate-binding protein n=1 Tax=Paenibacillus periandrae TaxID=1761741 RepID=UPI001F09587B|nr:iron-siderophore ABC transporter substrate-binding protein [Paenibacillus periandrae]
MPSLLRSARSPLLLILSVIVLFIAAGCGSNTQQTTPVAATPAPSTAASPQAEAPRVIKHAMGEETLTGTPKRVVILTNEGTEALLTVGIKPVGAVKSWYGEPWYDHIKADMKDVTVLGDELQPNIELIASLKPDLIIGNKVRQAKIYDQLKNIAPTVFSADLSGDWKTNVRLYTEAVNKKAEGEKAIAAFEKRVVDVKAKLGAKAATQISLIRFSAAEVRMYQKQTFAGLLLSQLGFARPASQVKDASFEKMTKESIPSMDGDVLFYFVTENTGKTDAANVADNWLKDPLFKNLNVSKANKVVKVNDVIWNSAGGIQAANLLLDEIVTYFEVK